MGNIIYKRKQTVNGGSSGGSSSLAGLTFQGEKTADFTATIGSFYEINANCTMTLPSSPSAGDKVGFYLLTGTFFATSTDAINGSFLAINYALKTTTPYVLFILTYDAINGWVWESRDNSYFSIAFTGSVYALTYSSDGDTNGLIYYLGTNQLNTSFSVTNVTNNATVTAVSTSGADNPSCAVDRNTTGGARSIWQSTTAAIGNWWKIDLGANHSVQLNKVMVLAPVGGTYGLIYGIKIQGSNDNSAWTDLTANSGTLPSNAWFSFTITNTSYWRYVRCYGTSDASSLVLKEIEFYGNYQL